MSDRRETWSRRQFVNRLTLAGTAGFVGMRPDTGAAERFVLTHELEVVQDRASQATLGHEPQPTRRRVG